MRDINILRQNSQFKRIYSRGRYVATPELVLYARKVNAKGGYGITASKKIGNAVQRNRAKRRLRAVWRSFYPNIVEGFDVVLVARSRTVSCKYETIEKSFLKAASELGILKESAL